MSTTESEKFFKQLSYIMDLEIKIVKKSKGLKTSLGSSTPGGSGGKPLIASVMKLL